MEKLIEIVKDTKATLSHICNGKVHYRIETKEHVYQLQLDSLDSDWNNNYIFGEYKSIELMRWIRKGLEKNDGTFILLK